MDENYFKKTEYPKINAPYKRWRKGLHTEKMKPKTKKWNSLKEGEFSTKEIEYLRNNDWCWTEKLDGTNIRIYLSIANSKVEMVVKGRTAKSEIPEDLLLWVENWFKSKTGVIKSIFEGTVILYGEGVGEKIQKGKLFGKRHFKLFDVKIGNLFLELENVQDIAQKLGLDSAPLYLVGTIQNAIDMVKTEPKSEYGNFVIEGLVGKPLWDLKDRRGNRIITKVKVKDFRQ